MKKSGYSLRARLSSFRYAFDGLISLFRNEPNATIHLVAAGVAVILGFILKINRIEWLLVSLVIGLVFLTELINSAIEKLSDVIEPGVNPDIKQVKDYAAAAVLISAVIAVIAAVIIFIPKMFPHLFI
jgi:diacylglycerol kinase